MEASIKTQEMEEAEMWAKADIAPEPGTVKEKQQLGNASNEGIDTIPFRVSKIDSAGYAFIYDTRTGDRSLTNRNMLATQLKKKREDGSTVFTTIKPSIEPFKGTCKCMLHPDDTRRKHYDELGLAVCKKANLRSPYEVKRHMQKRHKVEWETIEAERIERERQDDRAFQKNIMSMMVASSVEATEK